MATTEPGGSDNASASPLDFILWRDCSDLRRDRQVFAEHIEWLKGRVGGLEEVREPDPEIGRLTKQVQDLKMKNEKLQTSHDEVSVSHL